MAISTDFFSISKLLLLQIYKLSIFYERLNWRNIILGLLKMTFFEMVPVIRI